MTQNSSQTASTEGKRLTLLDAVFVVVILAMLILAPIAFFNGYTVIAAELAGGALLLAAAMKWMPSTPRS